MTPQTVLTRYASAAVMLAVMAWPSEGWSRAAGHACVRPDQIARQVDKWTEALTESWRRVRIDPAIVVRTYAAKDAILVPTCATGPLVGTDAITKYFTGFLAEHPVAAIDRATQEIRIGSDCRSAFATGLYTFTLDARGGERLAARYTYIYRLGRDGSWRIAHHHSSLQPITGAKCPDHPE